MSSDIIVINWGSLLFLVHMMNYKTRSLSVFVEIVNGFIYIINVNFIFYIPRYAISSLKAVIEFHVQLLFFIV